MPADFQSSNPFRRKGNPAALSPDSNTPTHSAALNSESFSNNASTGGAPANTPPEPEPPKRKKVVKRVRVQTPPPLSSDSESDGPMGAESPVESGWAAQDPFAGSEAESPVDAPTESGPRRRNPFSKTLHDIEPAKNQGESKTPARAAGRASLDVAAFSRLLLTGQAGANNPAGGSPSEGTSSTHTPDRDTESDSSLLPAGRSPVDPHHNPNANDPAPSGTPRTRNPESEAAPLIRANEPAAGQKKKPPPPSSRHGKAIRLQLGGDDKARQQPAPPTPPPLTRTPSDFNKPLPPAPLRSPEEEAAESVFDREAAGRVPEGSEPPSPAVSGYEVQGVVKRATPAPPPRRNREGEGRGGVTTSPSHIVEPQRRGSVESTHSRAESIRQPAPAPPPPRRPAHRSTGSITSPSSQSFTTPPYAGAPDANRPSSPRGSIPDPMNHKLAPPPPPTRNVSTRRKTGNNSIDSTRRGGKEREGAPLPPPRRQRGGSRSSLDSLSEAGSRRVGVDTLREEDEANMDDGQAGAILADLESLQKEVDALQKQYASSSQ